MDRALFKKYEEETDASFTDNLTDLFNCGFFETFLEMEIQKSKRYGDIFTIALIDVDSFTRYNKHHGSMKGDRILREIGKIILGNIRQSDLAARYGGDIFAVIFAKSEWSEALIALERIRKAVESLTDGNLTVSVGMASFIKDAMDKDILILKAKDALLRAKTSGKNNVFYLHEKPQSEKEERSNILVVDDDPKNVKYIEALLNSFGHNVLKCYSGYDVFSLIEKADIDLILLDIMMPEMDGFEVCQRLKSNERTRMIPVVMVTALDDTKSRIRGIEAGAEDFITKPPVKAELMARVRSLLKVNTINKRLISIESVLISLANAVEAKDPYTQGHTQRVASLAEALGKRVGLSSSDIDALKLGGILHDVGKIGVPERVLNKPGALDRDERSLIEKHPVIGHKICLPLEKVIGSALDIIRHHHEKLDGSGYPDGLAGKDLSLLARIMAIVDIYDALVSERSYRAAMPQEKAFQILTEEAEAGMLDKEIVKHLVDITKRFNNEAKNGTDY